MNSLKEGQWLEHRNGQAGLGCTTLLSDLGQCLHFSGPARKLP